MSSWTPTNYKTKNWSHYNRALKQRGSLSIWFDAEMAWEAKPSCHRGRQQAYSDAAIQACLNMKVLFGLPLRQTTGFVESLLELMGLYWSVPGFSTLCRRQKTLPVAIPTGLTGAVTSAHPLSGIAAQYPAGAADSTGIKAEGNARKHGDPKRRLWRKINIGINEQTLEIRAVEVTGSSIGPSRQIALQSPAGQWMR